RWRRGLGADALLGDGDLAAGRLARQPAQRLFDERLGAQAARGNAAHRADAVGGQMRPAQRYRDRENGAAIEHAFDAHAAAMDLDQLVDEGEADAAALLGAAALTLDAVEALEEPRHLVRGNAF